MTSRVVLKLRHVAASCALLCGLSLSAQLALLPAPRESAAGKAIPLNGGLSILCAGCDAEDSFAASELTGGLAAMGVTASQSASARITLLRSDSAAGRAALTAGHVDFIAAMHD